MINVKEFYKCLIDNDVDFFAGVPDSLLKDICAFITENTPENKHIITANEGGAVALGVGYHIATGKIPLIYMQNSGLGNAINPLLSLADKDVYSVPLLLMIGWRGEPGVKDEPQHKKQGRILLNMLDTMEIPYYLIDSNTNIKSIIDEATEKCKTKSCPIALVIKKNTFLEYKYSCKNHIDDKILPTREEALEEVIKSIPKKSVIISTTGMLSRELFELREKYKTSHKSDFLTVGSMGHASKIALGIAIAKPEKQVFCLDGDGSIIMQMGNYAIAGDVAPKNLKYILFNNAAHDSVGGQPTIAKKIDFQKTIQSFNIKYLGKLSDIKNISETVKLASSLAETCFIEILIKKGHRKNLGRPTICPQENIKQLKKYLKE